MVAIANHGDSGALFNLEKDELIFIYVKLALKYRNLVKLQTIRLLQDVKTSVQQKPPYTK